MLNALRPPPKKIGNTFKISVRMLHPTMFSTTTPKRAATTPKCNKATTPTRRKTTRRKTTPTRRKTIRRKTTPRQSKQKLGSPKKKRHLKK